MRWSEVFKDVLDRASEKEGDWLWTNQNERKKADVPAQLRFGKHFRIFVQLNGCDFILSVYFNEF